MNKILIKWTILWLGVVWVMFSNATKAATITEAMDGTINTLTICDENDNTKCITMMDRNLWATTNDITSTGSYWYHFQWWNNHGFSPFDDSVASNASTNDRINTFSPELYWPWNYFSWSIFKKITSNPYDWSSPSNDNLWWWTWDSADNNRWYNTNTMRAINVEDRRWPCDTWYHVPSRWEWTALMDLWSNSSTNWSMGYYAQFQSDFKLPFAGRRNYHDANVYGMGDYAYFWSSSPYVGNDYAWNFYVDTKWVIAGNRNFRAYAYSVRCFKDSALGFSSSEGGDSEIIVNIAEFNWWQNTCSGSNYIFENIVAWTNTGTHTLSWVFQCAFGNGRSSSTVTLQLSGNLVADGDRVISGSNLMMKNSEWTVSPVWLKFADTLISTWKALTATQTLFQKTANLIWVASWVVEVQLTVPGWTPDGTYNWVLVLTY